MLWRSFFQSWECLYFVYSGFLRCVAWTFIIIFSQLTTTTYVSMRTSGKWIYSQLKFYWFNSLSRSREKDSLASIFAPSLDSFCSCSREREFPSESKKMECRLDYFSRVAGIGNNSFTYLVVIILWGGKENLGSARQRVVVVQNKSICFFFAVITKTRGGGALFSSMAITIRECKCKLDLREE